MSFEPDTLIEFPTKSGVYIMKDASHTVLYIGKANNLRQRLKQYFQKSGDDRAMIPVLRKQIASIDTIVTFTEKEALLLENTLIKKHQPKYNIILKDDKTYISLMVTTKDKWPMVKLIRTDKHIKNDGIYFGPFTSAMAARQTYEVLTKVFPLRQCTDAEFDRRKRPCLLYHIKKCVAPCVQKCTKEDYHSLVKHTLQFLEGKNHELLDQLQREMEEASEELKFERAQSLLLTIRQIREVTNTSYNTVQSNIRKTDVIYLLSKAKFALLVKLIFRDGKLIGSNHFDFSLLGETDESLLSHFLIQHYLEDKEPPKQILIPFSLPEQNLLHEILNIEINTPTNPEMKKLLQLARENALALYEKERISIDSNELILASLQEKLALNHFPTRIECFDNSHISGHEACSSMVVYIDGRKATSEYRLFKLKETKPGDDYGAMREVLSRRYIRAKSEDTLPQLIIVDGGKGQLNIAKEILKELDIVSCDLISLAKEESRHDKGLTKEKIYLPNKKEPVELDSHNSLLFFLQSIRDEAHRKAIQFHQKRRSKHTITSVLQQIPGIGPIKRKRLLTFFGSVKRIAGATDEEILSISGITKKDLKAIRSYLCL